MRFQKVTLLVPTNDVDGDIDGWDFTSMLDAPAPVVILDSEDVDGLEGIDTLRNAGHGTAAKQIASGLLR
jgi:hypothetical protein